MSAGEVSIEIDAAPDAVWAVVGDITRTGEWSPECEAVEWADDARGSGARFIGHNRQGNRQWDMHGVIDTVEPGRELAFHTERDGQVRTRWTYRLDPREGGTTLTESWERVVQIPPLAKLVERLVLGGRDKHNRANITSSLQRIKAIAESSTGT